MNKEIENQDFISKELAKYEPFETRIKELNEKYSKAKVNGIDDKENYDLCKIGHKEYVTVRTDIDKARVALKAKSLDFGRKIDARAKELNKNSANGEAYLLEQRKIVEDEEKRIEDARRKKIEEEEEREKQDELDRLEKIRLDQEAKQKELDEQQAKIDAANAKIQAEKDKIEADKQKAIDIEEAKKQAAETAKLEAENEAKRKAQEAKDNAEKEKQDALDSQKAEADKKQKAVEDKAKAEQAKYKAEVEAIEQAAFKEKERLDEIIRNTIECPACKHKFQLN